MAFEHVTTERSSRHQPADLGLDVLCISSLDRLPRHSVQTVLLVRQHPLTGFVSNVTTGILVHVRHASREGPFICITTLGVGGSYKHSVYQDDAPLYEDAGSIRSGQKCCATCCRTERQPARQRPR